MVGPFFVDCRYYCEPCGGPDSYEDIYFLRSDGITPASPPFTDTFRFEGIFNYSPQYYCYSQGFTPVAVYDKTFYGNDTAVLAAEASVWEQEIRDSVS